MKIIKRKVNNSKITAIQLEIPINIELFGERDLSECAEIAQQEINNNTGTIFQHLLFLTELVENGQLIQPHYFEMVQLLSKFGGGITELSAQIETEKARQKHIKKENKPLDLSGFSYKQVDLEAPK